MSYATHLRQDMKSPRFEFVAKLYQAVQQRDLYRVNKRQCKLGHIKVNFSVWFHREESHKRYTVASNMHVSYLWHIQVAVS